MRRVVLLAWIAIVTGAPACGGGAQTGEGVGGSGGLVTSGQGGAAAGTGGATAGTGGGGGAGGMGGSTGSGGAPPTCTGCSANQVCVSGTCMNLPNACPCPKESYCDLTTNMCIVGCTADDICDTGRICIMNTRQCQNGCRQDTMCGAGQICESLLCRTGCRTDAGCATGQICENLACQAGCRADAACGTGRICENLTCRSGCRTDGDCGAQACDPVSWTCAPPSMAPGVPGGTFNRINTSSYPATVATFRLDRNEVTVARFRPFVTAVVGGYRPASGSGKHAHLNGGQGLVNEGTGAGYEPGWNTTWNTELPGAKATWDSTAQLVCSPTYAAWTPSAGANENKPINCVSWFQAYSFCIWDGGFLASEAEWNYAAAGGSEQRVYPWGSSVPANNTALAVYGCFYNATGTCTGLTNLAAVGSVPAGNGRWSHADLGGNVWEWTFDWYAALTQPCVNCANTTDAMLRVLRGGSFVTASSYVRSVTRSADDPTARFYDVGFRCARSP